MMPMLPIRHVTLSRKELQLRSTFPWAGVHPGNYLVDIMIILSYAKQMQRSEAVDSKVHSK